MNMRVRLFALIGILGSIYSIYTQQKNPILYIIKTICPPQISQQIRGYYKGDIINLDEGWGIISEEDPCCAFSMIFTPDIIHEYDEQKTLKCLRRKKNVPFSWYDITLVKSGANYQCDIQKIAAQQAPERLPNHAIVIRIHPKFVEELIEPKNMALNTNLVYLPTIALKQKMSEKELRELEDEMASCILGSFDLDCLHTRTKKEVKQERASVISMITK